MKRISRVLAAIDSSAAAGPVLATAKAIHKLYGAIVDAVHVREGPDATARAIADRHGLALRTFAGGAVPTIVSMTAEDDVVALVLGSKALPDKRPTGHVASSVITLVGKPVVLVPPHAPPVTRIARILVPLDGTRASAEALASVVAMARDRDIEVVVLHVREAATVPRFSEQPQHEAEAWADEFLARHCGCSPREVRLETRVGWPPDQILRVAEDAHCQLVALSWAQVLTPQHALVVRNAIERSGIPILLVPRQVGQVGQRSEEARG